jgi:hypothetical protein
MVNVIGANGSGSTELGMEKAVAKQRKKGIYRGHDNSVRLEGTNAGLGSSVEGQVWFGFSVK